MVTPFVLLGESIERQSIPEPMSGCWLWLGDTLRSKKGAYPIMESKGRTRFAHRMSYLYYVGNIPAGLQIDHVCTNKLCVNPEHLAVVTRSENIRLGHWRTHGNCCRRGHVLNDDNTWIEKTGARHCKKCNAENQKRWKRKHKGLNQ